MSYREKTCPVCGVTFKSRSITCGRVCGQKLSADYQRQRTAEYHANNHSRRAARKGEGVQIITESRHAFKRCEKNIEMIVRRVYDAADEYTRHDLRMRNPDIFGEVRTC